MISDAIIPRLRNLAQDRGFTRSAMCNYLGLHTNSLCRIDDDTWSPRLDTVKKIEAFVRKFERAKTRTLSGDGWRIVHHDNQWWVISRGDSKPAGGPFNTPDAALDAGHRLKRQPSSVPTHPA